MQMIREINDGYVISKSTDCRKYLKEFEKEDREYFIVLGLDTKQKVLYREICHVGTLNTCQLHAREIFKKAIVMSANRIIVAHNHPSGDATPADEDILYGRKLKKAGELLMIPVIDQLVIGNGVLESFDEEL